MSPILRPFYIHHIPELEPSFYEELSLEVAFRDIYLSAEVNNLSNIGLEL